MEQSTVIATEQERSLGEAGLVDVKLLDVVSYAMAHNGISLVRSVTVRGGSSDLDESRLTIELRDAEGRLSKPFEMTVDVVAGRDTVVSDPQLLLDASLMSQVAEQRPGEILLTLTHAGREVASYTHPVRVLAAKQWLSEPPGLAWEMLASFVLPNAPEITALMELVSRRLAAATGSSSIEGYQGGPGRVDEIVEACWNELLSCDIAYAEPPASWADLGQKIRTPAEVISGRMGTCLDTTVVLAAALEQAGIHPLLWAMEGHILLGWWRMEASGSAATSTEVSPFLNMVDLDALEVIETTALTRGVSFQDAVRLGRQTIRENAAECIVDVYAARRSRIIPLPAVKRLESGQVEEIHYVPASHSVAPAEQPSTELPETSARAESKPVPARVRAWKNSLLDLSLRNRLINYSPGSGLPLVLSPGITAQVEDLLHQGRSVVLRPYDDVDHIHFVRADTDDARALPPELLTDLFMEQSSIYAKVPGDHYQHRMQTLAHKARTIQEETGANNLYLTLGTLVWKFKDRELRSPLILIPITLEPAARKQGLYRMNLDETGSSTPNFCLLEKIRSEFGVMLTALAEPPTDAAGIDIRATFKGLSRALAEHGLPFHVEEDAHLAVLMFGKFRLWKDLDEHWEQLTQQPLVRHLAFTPTEEFKDPVESADQVNLDDLGSLCPIPADSSQLRAVADLISGRSLVLEGPPGTGKSQTIANLLARCIAEGKRVLFVAEKRAALDVVQHRISDIGLADFALDLHDKGSRPVEVRRRIQASLDIQPTADLQGLDAERSVAQLAMDALKRYRDNLHEDNGAELSLYSARTKLLALGEGPTLTVGEEFVREATPDRVHQVETLLRQLPATADPVHPGPEAPWLFVGSDDGSTVDVARVRSACATLNEAMSALDGTACRAALDQCFSTEALQAVAGFASDPSLTTEQLHHLSTPAWRDAVGAALDDVEAITTRARALSATPALATMPMEELTAAAVAAAASGWWGRRKRLRAAAEALSSAVSVEFPTDRVGLPSLAQQLTALARDAHALNTRIRQLPCMSLPPEWSPLVPQPKEAVEQRADLVRHIASQVISHATPALQATLPELRKLSQDQVAHLQQGASAMHDLMEATSATPETIARWVGGRGLRRAWLTGRDTRHISDPRLHSLQQWISFRQALRPLVGWGLADAHTELLTGAVPADSAPLAFSRGLAAASVAERRHATGLEHFDASAHEKSIHRYVSAASTIRHELPNALAAEAWERRRTQSNGNSGRIGELRRLVNRQRGGMSVREMMNRYGELISEFMPCFLMSPDSLARFLPVGCLTFDLVVFDEASQIRVADAVGAMGRARSVAVVGDSKQMPPTSFAETALNLNDEEALEDEFGVPIEDEESILTECVQARVKRHWLSWHYRSQHESLIAFSNAHYYDGRLSSFPTPVLSDRSPDVQGHGINLVRVDGHFLRDGKGRAKRTNPVEAQAIVAEITRRFDAAPEGTTPSLGVVTFNQQQRTLIEHLLRERDDERILAALDGRNGEGLFVKNLENVQGDERDVILFSVAFSHDARGKLPLRFGPLNLAGGERRLNVAITRARRQVLLYCSFDPADLRAEETQSVGVKHLKAYLELAERGTDLLTNSVARSAQVDRHRDDIAARLRERGLVVTTDVGLSDFRIDLVVAHRDAPDTPVMAVLLDGPVWARRDTVSDRDALPSTVLRSQLGWPVVERVWLPAWLSTPEKVLDDLVAAVEAPPADTVPEPDPVVVPEPLSLHPDGDTPSSVVPMKQLTPKVEEMEVFTPWVLGWDRFLGMGLLDSLGRVQSSTREAQTTLGEIIAHEGPVHSRRAASVFARACGLERLSNTRFEEIMAVAPVQPDQYGFLWDPDQDPENWHRFRPDPEHHRSIEEISPHEIANAMKEACRRSGGLREDELQSEALRTFGFKRRTTNTIKHLQMALQLAVEMGRLQEVNGYYEAR